MGGESLQPKRTLREEKGRARLSASGRAMLHTAVSGSRLRGTRRREQPYLAVCLAPRAVPELARAQLFALRELLEAAVDGDALALLLRLLGLGGRRVRVRRIHLLHVDEGVRLVLPVRGTIRYGTVRDGQDKAGCTGCTLKAANVSSPLHVNTTVGLFCSVEREGLRNRSYTTAVG